MRPQSIVMFERLFLASLALGVLGFVLSYQDVAELLASDAAVMQLGLGSGSLMGIVIGIVIVSYAVYLLLWHLIARRASNVAKWILVVFTVIGVLYSLPALAGPWTLNFVLSLLVYALEVGAVVYLFHPDARAWLGGKGQADPATFD